MTFLIDPAIPTEALLPEDFISNDPHIEPASWREYPEAIKPSDGHDLFPGTEETPPINIDDWLLDPEFLERRPRSFAMLGVHGFEYSD